MPHYVTWSLRDYTNETSPFRVNSGAITAVSIAGFLTAIGTGRAAVEGITEGIVAKEQWVGDSTDLSAAIPTAVTAQVERKWLIRYHDTVTQKKYRSEIPTAELVAGRLLTNSDFANLADADMATFVTWFNGFARSPDSDTNAVVIDSIQHVGRNI
jgi:hypothetical protein